MATPNNSKKNRQEAESLLIGTGETHFTKEQLRIILNLIDQKIQLAGPALKVDNSQKASNRPK